jgi:uncharacterized protein
MIERDIQGRLLKLIKRKEILALVGARQVGKTTLMKWLYEKIGDVEKTFISFDSQEILSLFEYDTDSFVNIYVKGNDYLFIDEFQYSKEGGKKLKRIYDEVGVKIVISGSSVPELSIHSLQFLAGRVLTLRIDNLSLGEIIRYKNKDFYNSYLGGVGKEVAVLMDSYLSEYIIYGGYPEVVLEDDNLIKKEILRGLVNTYLLKEVRDILSYKNSYEFQKVLELLSINLGSLLNKSGLSSNLQLTRYRFEEILSLLEKTFVIDLLRPMSHSKIKELVKSPKVYFRDNGFRNYLLNNLNPLQKRTDKGFLYEGFILSELRKADLDVKFYNYRNGAEIDFIVKYGNRIIGMEVKSSLTNLNVEKSFSGFIGKVKPHKIYVFNERMFGEREIRGTKVIFTHLINLKSIINKEFINS